MKKDNRRAVVVTNEIGTKPGLVRWTQFIEEGDPRVKIKESEVLEFPKLEELKPIHLKINNLKLRNNQIEISSAEILT